MPQGGPRKKAPPPKKVCVAISSWDSRNRKLTHAPSCLNDNLSGYKFLGPKLFSFSTWAMRLLGPPGLIAVEMVLICLLLTPAVSQVHVGQGTGRLCPLSSLSSDFALPYSLVEMGEGFKNFFNQKISKCTHRCDKFIPLLLFSCDHSSLFLPFM